MKFTLITAILLGWVCIGKSDDGHITCCLTVTNTRIPVENIVNYDIQEMHTICAIRAVRFYTKRNKVICSDPDSSWAKRAMEVVNGRRKLDGLAAGKGSASSKQQFGKESKKTACILYEA